HYERESETMVAGVRIRAPMMRIHTVAAGGGSICTFDGARFQVGPHSAGAVPGPACYRRGGPLTVTDCNVMLGKIVPDHFPNIFGPDGNAPLDADVVRDKFEALVTEVASATGKQMCAEEIAEGFVAIAVANMANAIKKISIERGHDVTRYTLACFGGAGGQHACLVADALGMDRVMIHPLAGVLSAYGMGLADRRAIRERTFGGALEQTALGPIVQSLSAEAAAELRAQGVEGEVRSEATVHIRYVGTDSSIEIPYGDVATMQLAFEARHSSQFGFLSDKALVVEMVRVEAIHASEFDADIHFAPPASSNLPIKNVPCFMDGARRSTPLFDRNALGAGFSASGPAIIIDPVSTTIVEPGWKFAVDATGNLMLSRSTPRTTGGVVGTEVDPVRLEIMGGLFMAIAEEMGAALQHSASSVNIRERLDFSCALFDAKGNLVANAPHMPVHLGSMGESVRAILSRRGDGADGRGICPGDVYALNAPYDGGTHLPDITVIMPV
ncbi:MAG: hydantoinase/oxoprolinase family protein, partial [Sphingorhabdus sp.]